jgi:hypothetical protein
MLSGQLKCPTTTVSSLVASSVGVVAVSLSHRLFQARSRDLISIVLDTADPSLTERDSNLLLRV